MGEPTGRRLRDAEFATFVEARADALLRYARILVPDAERAQRLTRDVLLQVRAQWADVAAGGLEDEVRDRLARAAAGQRRWLSRTPSAPAPAPAAGQATGQAGPRSPAQAATQATGEDVRLAHDDGGSAPSPAMVAAVDALEPTHRVVLVSRHVDQLDDEAIARRLGVRRELVETMGHGVVPLRLVAPALRAHERSAPSPADPVAWVDDARRSRTRRRWAAAALAVAAVVLLGVATGGVARWGGAGPARLATSTAPAGQHLLPWPAAGDLRGQTGPLAAAAAAWAEAAPAAERPSGPVYPLLAQTLRGVPVYVLQADDSVGLPHLAVVSGQQPSLVITEALPVTDDTPVVALRVPVVFATGASAIHGDEATDALLLSPEVQQSAAVTASETTLTASEAVEAKRVGWQQVVPAGQNRWLYASAAGSPRDLWLPLVATPSEPALTALARDVAGTVELDVVDPDGSSRPTLWQLPGEGDPDLLLQPTLAQVGNQAEASTFRPADYSTAIDLWRRLGRGGPFTATFLARHTTPDGVSLDLVELARPAGIDPVLVQRGVRDGDEVCFAAQPLRRFGAEAYPYLVAGCSYVLPAGTQRATVLQAWSSSQTPRQLPIVVSLQTRTSSGTVPTRRTETRTTLNAVSLSASLSPPGDIPVRLSVTAGDQWNNLPPFVWRWRFDSAAPRP